MKPSILPLATLALALLDAQAWAQGSAPRAAERWTALELASRDSAGLQGDSWSGGAAVSADGRYVAFHSISGNLVPGDTNGHYDVFVRDRLTGSTERVSVDSFGGQADDSSVWPALSADGRYVAFQSFATNLAPDPNGFRSDAFVHDLWTGTTLLVSVGHAGQAADENCVSVTISGDGRYVAFHTAAGNLVPDDTNATSDVFVRDWVAGTTVRASLDATGGQSDGYSADPSLSFEGRFVAFHASGALVPEDADGGFFDVYVRDLLAGETVGVTAADPAFASETRIVASSLSADGSRIAFESAAVHYPLIETSHVHVRDVLGGATETLSQRFGVLGNDDSSVPAISADGGVVAFESRAANLVPGDGNGAADVFVHE